MDAAKMITFNPADGLDVRQMVNQFFTVKILEDDLTEYRTYNISSEVKLSDVVALLGGAKAVWHWKDTRWPTHEQYLFEGVAGTATVVSVQHYAEYGYEVMLAAVSAESADFLMAQIVAALPPVRSKDPSVVPVDFWALTRQGASRRVRQIVAPTWQEIDTNYTLKAEAALDTIMKLTPPMDGGKLLLWHGLPGTGKSYAIRALMREWRPWCKAHYILDPEKFFGEADYMLSVILDQCGGTESSLICDDDDDDCPALADKSYDGPPWNLLVMEDSDEFLQADAKDRQGQSLSRLLNLADGLVGQGLNLLVLITTNEPLGKIHPAVQREGRCLANVEFGKLTSTEVMDWALAHHVAPDSVPAMLGDGGTLLSDLYGKARMNPQVKAVADKRALGFKR